MTPKRKRIGRWNDLATRQVLYKTDRAIEIDEIDHFEVQRKRVLFEDVLLVTKHHYVGVGFVITMLIVGIALIVTGISIRETAAVIIFGILAAPFLLAAILRVILGVEVITVFGKRSRAAEPPAAPALSDEVPMPPADVPVPPAVPPAPES
jgi:hypothetical protein